MYCKQCKVKIRGNTNICPLCHEHLFAEETENIEAIYPENVKVKKPVVNTFRKIYAYISVNILILFAIINRIWIENTVYNWLVLGVLIYIYILVEKTILSRKNTANKIYVQTVFVIALCFLIQYVFNTPEWVVSYAIPCAILISALVMAVFTLIYIRNQKEYLLYFFRIAMWGLLPIIVRAFSSRSTVIWPALLSSLISVLIVSALIVFRWKDFYQELRKKFHT